MEEREQEAELKSKLVSETAKIPWVELQRFFAQGVVLNIDGELDLIEIAQWMSEDNKEKLQPLLDKGQVAAPSDDLAKQWYASDATLWSVVVAPFVLVQVVDE